MENWGLKECDDQDRVGFIRKVYSILFSQIALTAVAVWYVTYTAQGFCLAKSCTFYEGTIAYWMQEN